MIARRPRHLSVYDGRRHLGVIVDDGKIVHAFNRDGEFLGEFRSVKVAFAAFDASGSQPISWED
jgi:hypothetical protein